LTDRRNLTVDGNGATWFTATTGPTDRYGRSHRPILHIAKGSGVVVRDLVIDGPNTPGRFNAAFEEEPGILVAGAQNTTLRDVTVRQVYGDAVSVYAFKPGDGSGKVVVPRGVLITGLDARLIGRQGIAIVSSAGVTVSHSHFDGVARSVFDLEPIPTTTVSNVVIERNTVDAFELAFVAGLGAGRKDGVIIRNNRSTEQPIWMKFAGFNFTIEGNIGTGIAIRPMINVLTGAGIRVIGNKQLVGKEGVKCPPNCGNPAISLGGHDARPVCDVYAANNIFTGARALFGGTAEPSESCPWTDGGGNSL
jgi:hypothetical protein